MKIKIAATVAIILVTSSTLTWSSGFYRCTVGEKTIITNTPCDEGDLIISNPDRSSEPPSRTRAAAPPEQKIVFVDRLYRSSTDYHRAVVRVHEKTFVRCTLFDRHNNPLVVSTQIVSPPHDEVIFHSGSASRNVKFARCYKDD